MADLQHAALGAALQPADAGDGGDGGAGAAVGVLCGVLAALGLCVFILRRRRRRSLGALGGAPGRRGKTQPMQTPMMDPTFTTSSSYVPPPMAADFRAPPPGMNPMNVQGAP